MTKQLIETGDEFTVEYGNGRTLQVRALNFRDKEKAFGFAETVRDSTKTAAEKMQAIRSAFALVCENADELLSSTIDDEEAMTIVSKTLQKLSIEKEAELAKKSESQP